MNIVVTKNKVTYSRGFMKLASLEEACEVVGTIDVLVYNNSDESSDKRIECLGVLKDKAKMLVYICSEVNTDLAVKMMVIGSEGKYFDDEFFLESDSELENLINSLDEVTAIANLGGISVLSEFFQRYLKNGSSNFNPNYLMVVKEAVNSLIEEYNQKNLEIIQMSETATDIFSNTSALLLSMRKEQENMQDVLKRMSNKIKEPQVVPSRGPRSSVLFYPRINYPKSKSIIRVKEIGSFRFFVSFMLSFRKYLEAVKNLRPKLIFALPVGELYEKRYSDFNWVTVSNSKAMVNYYNSVVFTNCPSKEVIEKLLDDRDYDTFIVADMLVFDNDHILNCKGGSVKYAVSGLSCIEKFNLQKKDCIMSMIQVNGVLGVVPMSPEYPKDVSSRERFYMSELSAVYENLLTAGLRKG